MSWAFLETMKTDVYWNISYVQVSHAHDRSWSTAKADNVKILQNTRALLQEHYSQIPQLSCGYQLNLNSPFRI